MNFLKRSWNREEKLWKVFWLYYVVGNIILRILAIMMALILPPLAVIVMVVGFVYSIYMLICIWRCAFNVKTKFWGYVARVFVGIIPLFLLLGVLTGGLLKGQELMKAAEHRKAEQEGRLLSPQEQQGEIIRQRLLQCKQVMTDYAVKNHVDPNQYIARNVEYLKKCAMPPGVSVQQLTAPQQQQPAQAQPQTQPVQQ